jgi:hypothetical protein
VTLLVRYWPRHPLAFQGPCSCSWQLVSALHFNTLQAHSADLARTPSRLRNHRLHAHSLLPRQRLRPAPASHVLCVTKAASPAGGVFPPPSDVGRDSTCMHDRSPHTDAASLLDPLRSCRRSGCCACVLIVRPGSSTHYAVSLTLARFFDGAVLGIFKLSGYVVIVQSTYASISPL